MDLNQTDLKVISFLNKLYFSVCLCIFLYRAYKLYGTEWKTYILMLTGIILIFVLLKLFINLFVKAYFAREKISRL